MVEVIYTDNGVEKKETVDLWNNRERLKELQELFENVRIPQNEIYNNYDAYQIK